MKIVYLTAYFYPEKYAGADIYWTILTELAKEHDVHVIAPQPSRGVSEETFQEYRQIETWNGMTLHRFPMEREQASTLKRIMRYRKCERWYKKLSQKLGSADYVFAASTPPTMGVLAGKIAKKLKARLIYSIQDLFPESLVSSGILRKPKGFIWWLGRRIEKRTYRNADYITVISTGFYNNLLAKGVPQDKLVLIPNWVDLQKVVLVDKHENTLYGEFGISHDKFNVVYAGNMGAAQNTKLLIEVAERLKDEDSIRFVVFGGGIGYADFETAIREKKLENVMLNPLLPQERVSEVYGIGDIALIVCKQGVGKTALPSKAWNIMACDTPIIASFDLDSELVRVLLESKAGVCVEPDNAQALSDEIVRMSQKPIQVSTRQYIHEYYSKETLLKRYLQLFEKSAEGSADKEESLK